MFLEALLVEKMYHTANVEQETQISIPFMYVLYTTSPLMDKKEGMLPRRVDGVSKKGVSKGIFSWKI